MIIIFIIIVVVKEQFHKLLSGFCCWVKKHPKIRIWQILISDLHALGVLCKRIMVCTWSNDDMTPYARTWLYVTLVMWDVSNTAALAQPAKWIQNIPNLLRLAQFAKGTVDDICGGDQQGSLHPRHTCHHRWRALSSSSEFCHLSQGTGLFVSMLSR